MIDALQVILEKDPKIYLDIIGDGPIRKELEEHVALLGISDKVVFRGRLVKSSADRKQNKPMLFINISFCLSRSVWNFWH